MSEQPKNPFEPFFDEFRRIVREEIRAASNGNGNGHKAEDRFLDPAEAAKRLSVSEDWLYHNAKKLPFTRRLGPRLLRFSEQGLMRWVDAKKFTGA